MIRTSEFGTELPCRRRRPMSEVGDRTDSTPTCRHGRVKPYLKSTLQSRAANAIRRMPCVRAGDQLPLSFHRAHFQEPGEALVIVQQELGPAAATAAVLP